MIRLLLTCSIIAIIALPLIDRVHSQNKERDAQVVRNIALYKTRAMIKNDTYSERCLGNHVYFIKQGTLSRAKTQDNHAIICSGQTPLSLYDNMSSMQIFLKGEWTNYDLMAVEPINTQEIAVTEIASGTFRQRLNGVDHGIGQSAIYYITNKSID